MAIVDFNAIQKVMPSEAQPLSDETAAMGSVNALNRTTLYDPFWGYFTMRQHVNFIYNEADAYQDVAEFQIRGVFTANAELQNDGHADPAAFAALTAKLSSLEAAFEVAGMSQPPSDPEAWFGPNDPRCIVLPEPLRDADGNRIYAVPASVEVEQTRFPVSVAYVATLREAKISHAKLRLNDIIIDNGVVTIVPPAPLLKIHSMVRARGAVLQVKNYSTTEIECSGTVPCNTGQVAMPAKLKSLIDGLAEGQLDASVLVPKADRTVEVIEVFTGLDAESHSVDLGFRESLATVQVKGRERHHE
jgi:hypothetical protein